MWDIARDHGPDRRPPKQMHHAALGAVHLATRGTGILEGAEQLDHWRTIDGHIDMDWKGGPFAEEVVLDLLADAEDLEASHVVDPGSLLPCFNRIGDLNAVWLYGVRVRFRPYKPIGAEKSRQMVWDKLRA